MIKKCIWLTLALNLLLTMTAATASYPGSKVSYPEGLVSYPLVLEYHQICPTVRQDIEVSLENFKKELDWLQNHGYHTLSMDRFLSCLNKQQPLPAKSVLITFDDGYEGVYTYALPELRQRFMHATLFLSTDDLGKVDKTDPRMTLEQVKKISHDYLIDIGSHTVMHGHLSELSNTAQQNELQHSKAVLEQLTGKQCLSMAYPYGDFNQQVIANVKAAGYQVAFAGYNDDIASHLNRYTVPRIFAGRFIEKDNFKFFKKIFN